MNNTLVTATHGRGMFSINVAGSSGPDYVGYVEGADCNGVYGWAADRSRLNNAITVTLYDGSIAVATVPADGSRPDVGNFLHDNGLHGFTIPIPSSLKNGVSHTLSVKFENSSTTLANVDNPSTNTRTITCATAANYAGYVEGADCNGVYGWAADRSRPNTSINVTLYDGSTAVATVPANGSRPDVGSFLSDNGLHGFTIPIPSSLKNGVAHTLSVKFENSNSALPNSNIAGSTRTITCAAAANYVGYVDGADCNGVYGWAADWSRLNTSITVTLYDGSNAVATVTANGSRSDVGNFLGDNGLHGFTIPIPSSLKNGVAHTLSVKFENSNSALPNSNIAGSMRTITCAAAANYVGYVEGADCNGVYGWAADRSRLNTSITVTLYDGSNAVATATANGSRPDVGSFLGDNGLHGFTIPIPSSLKNGVSHTLSVKFENSGTTLPNVNIAGSTRTITCAAAANYVGYVEGADCNGVYGWAADRSRLNTAITVTLYDGSTAVATATANGSRPDVGNFLGDNGLHGFTIPIPSSLKNGVSHTLSVKFENSSTALPNVNNPSTNTRTITCTTVSSPQVNSVSPNPLPLFNADQSVQVFGNSFQTNLTVDVFNSSGTKIGMLSGPGQVQNVTPTSFTMVIFLGSSAGTFGIEIVNPDSGRCRGSPFQPSLRIQPSPPLAPIQSQFLTGISPCRFLGITSNQA